jgi:hypothetical protein
MTLGLYFLEYDECLSLDLYSSVNVQVTKSLVGLIWFELPEQEDLVLWSSFSDAALDVKYSSFPLELTVELAPDPV